MYVVALEKVLLRGDGTPGVHGSERRVHCSRKRETPTKAPITPADGMILQELAPGEKFGRLRKVDVIARCKSPMKYKICKAQPPPLDSRLMERM